MEPSGSRAEGHVTEKDRANVLQLAESIANKLLHDPTTALKHEAAADTEGTPLVDAVRSLFDLGDEEAQETGERPPVVAWRSTPKRSDGGQDR